MKLSISRVVSILLSASILLPLINGERAEAAIPRTFHANRFLSQALGVAPLSHHETTHPFKSFGTELYSHLIRGNPSVPPPTPDPQLLIDARRKAAVVLEQIADVDGDIVPEQFRGLLKNFVLLLLNEDQLPTSRLITYAEFPEPFQDRIFACRPLGGGKAQIIVNSLAYADAATLLGNHNPDSPIFAGWIFLHEMIHLLNQGRTDLAELPDYSKQRHEVLEETFILQMEAIFFRLLRQQQTLPILEKGHVHIIKKSEDFLSRLDERIKDQQEYAINNLTKMANDNTKDPKQLLADFALQLGADLSAFENLARLDALDLFELGLEYPTDRDAETRYKNALNRLFGEEFDLMMSQLNDFLIRAAKTMVQAQNASEEARKNAFTTHIRGVTVTWQRLRRHFKNRLEMIMENAVHADEREEAKEIPQIAPLRNAAPVLDPASQILYFNFVTRVNIMPFEDVALSYHTFLDKFGDLLQIYFPSFKPSRIGLMEVYRFMQSTVKFLSGDIQKLTEHLISILPTTTDAAPPIGKQDTLHFGPWRTADIPFPDQSV